MSVFPLESRQVINLNIVLLLCVSVEPFLFNIVRNAPAGVTDLGAYADVSSTLYALDLAALFGILGGFALTLASDERKLIPKGLIRRYRFEGASQIACGLIFVVSALPIFFTLKGGTGEPVRYYLWIVPLLLIWVSRRFERRLEESGGGRSDGAQTSKL
jgi:hypothetical protein